MKTKIASAKKFIKDNQTTIILLTTASVAAAAVYINRDKLNLPELDSVRVSDIYEPTREDIPGEGAILFVPFDISGALMDIQHLL